MIYADGWMAGVERVPSVRHSPLDVEHPLCIVHHCTATVSSPQALARRIAKNRGPHVIAGPNKCPPKCDQHDRQASWHLIVGKDGRLWQSVPFLRGSWHTRGMVQLGDKRWRTNRVSIGIEWQHRGPVDGKWGEYTIEQKAVWPTLRARLMLWLGGDVPQFGHYELGNPVGEHSDPGTAWMKFIRGG